jgi:hypothetical protein
MLVLLTTPLEIGVDPFDLDLHQLGALSFGESGIVQDLPDDIVLVGIGDRRLDCMVDRERHCAGLDVPHSREQLDLLALGQAEAVEDLPGGLGADFGSAICPAFEGLRGQADAAREGALVSMAPGSGVEPDDEGVDLLSPRVSVNSAAKHGQTIRDMRAATFRHACKSLIKG